MPEQVIDFRYNSSTGTLKLDEISTSSGTDAWGEFDSTTVTWNVGVYPVYSIFRVYKDIDVIDFEVS